MKHRSRKKISEGKFYPLGAALFHNGVNFAIYSHHAKQVFLLLFDKPDGNPTDIIELEKGERHVWHVFVHGVKAGQLYGYKIRGDYDPKNGLRFNENKFLIDPYSKAVTGKAVNKNGLLFGYDSNSDTADLSFDNRDSSAIMPKSVVIDDKFNWQNDKHPDIPLEKSIIYEAHLKGFTADKSSRVKHPGTYLGFIEKIPYLKKLGITAVELLPIQEHYVEDFLIKKGLTNYWGYNTIGFFAPESSYSVSPKRGGQTGEFKTLVRELHKEGIEVILDVVYNHTGEGNELGPTLCFRGIDNPIYYCLNGQNDQPKRFYYNYTGCGNAINSSNPHVIKFILDSLRYWVEVMHVDGFRFDLASVLGRDRGEFTNTSAFFDVISQDPVLSRVKLIAEPWDLEMYAAGKFPIDWSEWNGRFRDTIRRFFKGDQGQLFDLQKRMAGSPDLYGEDGRTPYNSINFVTCHDGFTLNDLVSYNSKHNEANKEENKDGTNDNWSCNCGEEGLTQNKEIQNERIQLAKNFVCALFFASGTPMFLGGDEFLRTQKGNNNAYCQDNKINWFDWNLAYKNRKFTEFCINVINLIKNYRALQMKRHTAGYTLPEMLHFKHAYYDKNLNEPNWSDPNLKTFSVHLYAKEKNGKEYDFFGIQNADSISLHVSLPQLESGKKWKRKIDTSLKLGEDFTEHGKEVKLFPTDFYIANPRSTILLLA